MTYCTSTPGTRPYNPLVRGLEPYNPLVRGLEPYNLLVRGLETYNPLVRGLEPGPLGAGGSVDPMQEEQEICVLTLL